MKKLFIILLQFAVLQASAQDPAYPPAPAAPLNIVTAEYFIDTDPGFGAGINIPVTAALDIPSLVAGINTAALTAGAHKLYIRTLNAEGRWSITSVRQFIADFDVPYPTAPAAPLNVVKAEYFIDTDPGFGAGINIPVTAALDIASLAAGINTAALPTGSHKLFVRTLNDEGEWSITSVRQFTVDFDPAYPAAATAPQNITSVEYFIDTDPGFGNGVNMPVTAAVDINGLVAGINTNLLSPGGHRLYIRSRNTEGEWSLTSIKNFVVDEDPAYATVPAAPGNIVAAEYFIDTDPGFGNATAITLTPGADITNLSFDVNTAALTAGTHVLYVRSKDDWSITSTREFSVAVILPLQFLNFAAVKEQQAVRLNWSTASEINTSHFEVERSTDSRSFEKIGSKAAANSTGNHDYAFTDNNPPRGTVYYRIKQLDKDGRFTYSAVVRVTNIPEEKLVIYPSPAVQQVQVDFAGRQPHLDICIYDMQGKIVLQEQRVNGTPLKINIEKLPPGKYILVLKDGKVAASGMFMKQ